MRWALGAWLLAALLIHFTDSFLGPGFYNQTLTVQSRGQALSSARLSHRGPNLAFNLPPREGATPSKAEFLLASRSLLEMRLHLPSYDGKATFEAGLLGQEARFKAVEVRQEPDKSYSLDLSALLAPWRLKLPILGELYFCLSQSPQDQAKRWTLGLAAALMLGLLWLGHAKGGRISWEGNLRPAAPGLWPLAAFLISLSALLLLEMGRPWFFATGDNHRLFLPKIHHGFQALGQGRFPWFDELQILGTPLWDVGTYAVFDPLMMLSRLLALAASKPFATLEIYVLLALSLAASLLTAALRRLGAPPLQALAGALGWALAGYHLKVGSNWYYVCGSAFYLSWIFYFFSSASKGGKGWTLGLGLVRGFFFYAGNAQFFLYGCVLELLLYIANQGRAQLQRYGLSLLLSLGLCLPLALPQYQMTRQVPHAETQLASTGIPPEALAATSLTQPLVSASYPGRPPGDNDTHTDMYHVGALWCALALFGLGAWLAKARLPQSALFPIGAQIRR